MSCFFGLGWVSTAFKVKLGPQLARLQGEKLC